MRSRIVHLLLALVLSLIMIALLAARSELVQQYLLTPLLTAIWLVMLLVSAVPQALVWAMLVVLALRTAFRSLSGPRRRHVPPRVPPPPSQSRVGIIAGWLRAARGSDYYKMQLARHLGELAVEVSSPRLLQAEGHAWQHLREGDLAAPPEILKYFQAAVAPPSSRPSTWRTAWRRMFNPSPPAPTALDVDPEQVVRYLEQQLESPHERER